MPEFVHFLIFWSRLLCLPALVVAALIFHHRNRIIPTLTVALGFITMTAGSLLEVFAPYHKATLDEMQNALSTQSVPAAWYIGSVIINGGMIIVVVGFFHLALRTKCTLTDKR